MACDTSFPISHDIFRGSFWRKEEFRERIGKILFVLVGCKRFERRMTQTTQHFHEVSDSFQERIDVWGWMMWPLWPEGGGSGGQSPEWPEPEGIHSSKPCKGHSIVQGVHKAKKASQTKCGEEENKGWIVLVLKEAPCSCYLMRFRITEAVSLS